MISSLDHYRISTLRPVITHDIDVPIEKKEFGLFMKGKRKIATMQTPEIPFVISMASCGEAKTSIMTACSTVDVKRAILFQEWRPNGSYFYQNLGLRENQQMFAVLVGVCSSKGNFWKLTPADIGKLEALRELDDEMLLAVLPDDLIEELFNFAFTGGEGEQTGNPGEEWTTITVEPLAKAPFPSVYRIFDLSTILTIGAQIRYHQAAGFRPSEDDQQSDQSQ